MVDKLAIHGTALGFMVDYKGLMGYHRTELTEQSRLAIVVEYMLVRFTWLEAVGSG